MDHRDLFWLVVAVEGNALVTGLPGTGKTSLVKWSLSRIPPGYAVVVYDTAGDFRGLCDHYDKYNVNLVDLPIHKAMEIIEESLAATYGEYSYIWTPAMAELFSRAVEEAKARSLPEVRRRVLEIAEAHEIDTAYAVKRRLAHFTAQFDATDVPLEPGRSTCVDISALDRVGRLAYVLGHLELTRHQRHVIYVIDEAHRFLAFAQRYSLLTDHLRTGRAGRRFFVLVSHSFREFSRHIGYIKAAIRFPDWEMDEGKMVPLSPSEAVVTVRAGSETSAEALKKLGIPLAGTYAQFRLRVPPYGSSPSR